MQMTRWPCVCSYDCVCMCVLCRLLRPLVIASFRCRCTRTNTYALLMQTPSLVRPFGNLTDPDGH